MGTKSKPGRFDCYERAEEHEETFTLRAHDPLAPDIVKQWAQRARASGVDEEKVAEALACADRMRRQHRVMRETETNVLTNEHAVRLGDTVLFWPADLDGLSPGVRVVEVGVCVRYADAGGWLSPNNSVVDEGTPLFRSLATDSVVGPLEFVPEVLQLRPGTWTWPENSLRRAQWKALRIIRSDAIHPPNPG